jgi:hypothetical protein
MLFAGEIESLHHSCIDFFLYLSLLLLMRIIIYILSLNILVLIAIPCIDLPQDNLLHRIELSTKTSDSHQNDLEHCSPFCTCYCCSSPIFYQTYTFQLYSFSLVKEYYSDNHFDFVSSAYTSIWQPPELS